MCSALLRIFCTTFWFPMTTINISLNVLVCGTYFFYLGIEYLHNIFHLTDGCLMCCTHALIHQIWYFFAAFIHANITTTWILFFSDVLEVFTVPLISYTLEVSLSLFSYLLYVFVKFMLSNLSDWTALLMCKIVLLTPDSTPLVLSRMCLLILIILSICLIRKK